MFFFKCGHCGKLYSVDETHISDNSFGSVCPNCDCPVPYHVRLFAKSLVEMKTHPNTEQWEIFRIPQESKAQLNLTLPQELI